MSTSLDQGTFVSLEAMSRKAANDSLSAKGGHLADDQFDSLAVHLLGIGIRAFERFDETQTMSDRDGFSFAYRAMRGYRDGRFTEGPYVDWLRTSVRDSRFEPDAVTAVTETGELPERHEIDAQALEAVVEHYAGGLPEREAWTLRHVATAIAEGLTLVEVCNRLLADLADALRPQIPAAPTGPTSMEFFETWFREAA